jgi:hypothetical protein
VASLPLRPGHGLPGEWRPLARRHRGSPRHADLRGERHPARRRPACSALPHRPRCCPGPGPGERRPSRPVLRVRRSPDPGGHLPGTRSGRGLDHGRGVLRLPVPLLRHGPVHAGHGAPRVRDRRPGSRTIRSPSTRTPARSPSRPSAPTHRGASGSSTTSSSADSRRSSAGCERPAGQYQLFSCCVGQGLAYPCVSSTVPAKGPE